MVRMGVPWRTTLFSGLVVAWCVVRWRADQDPNILFIAGLVCGVLLSIWLVWAMMRFDGEE